MIAMKDTTKQTDPIATHLVALARGEFGHTPSVHDCEIVAAGLERDEPAFAYIEAVRGVRNVKKADAIRTLIRKGFLAIQAEAQAEALQN
jgi:hypothetical protein